MCLDTKGPGLWTLLDATALDCRKATRTGALAFAAMVVGTGRAVLLLTLYKISIVYPRDCFLDPSLRLPFRY